MYDAFLDELVKIAEYQDDVTKERLKRGLKLLGAGAAGAGLGYGAGAATGRWAVPKVFRELGPKGIRRSALVGSALGAAGGLAFQAARAAGQDYARGEDEE